MRRELFTHSPPFPRPGPRVTAARQYPLPSAGPHQKRHGESAGSIASPSAVAAQPVAAEEMNWSLP
jgi:hypothetical protein